MTIRKLILGLLAFTMAGTASASVLPHLFTIDAFDDFYGSYSGKVSTPGSFSWYSASGFYSGDIDLTEGGDVIAHIVATNDDKYTLYTADAAIGAPCAANACVAVTDGETVSLYDTIASLNHFGVCCDFNGVTPLITVNSVPEPATWSLLILGFGGLGAVLRSRRTAVPAIA